MTWDVVQYTGRSGRVLLHRSVGDKMQFAVGMYSSLHRTLSVACWVKDTLRNAFKVKQGTWKRGWKWKWEWKRRDRERQTAEWQYTILTLCTSNPQVYMWWKGVLTSNHPMRKLTSSTSQLKVQNSDQWH